MIHIKHIAFLLVFGFGISMCAAQEDGCSQANQSPGHDETSLMQLKVNLHKAEEATKEALNDSSIISQTADERIYLPKSVQGEQVLDLVHEQQGIWLARKKRVIPDKVGIHFRHSKNLDDRDPDRLYWGEHLSGGIDEGDGWVSFAKRDFLMRKGDLHVARLLKQFSKSNAQKIRSDHAAQASSSTCHKDTPSRWDKDTWWQLNEVAHTAMEHCPHAVAAAKRHGLTCMDHLGEKVGVNDRLCNVCAASCAAQAQACPCENEAGTDSAEPASNEVALQQRSEATRAADRANVARDTVETSVARKEDDAANAARYESVREAIAKDPHDCSDHPGFGVGSMVTANLGFEGWTAEPNTVNIKRGDTGKVVKFNARGQAYIKWTRGTYKYNQYVRPADFEKLTVSEDEPGESGCWQHHLIGDDVTASEVYNDMCGGDDGLIMEVSKTRKHDSMAFNGECRYANSRYSQIGTAAIIFSKEFGRIDGKDCSVHGPRKYQTGNSGNSSASASARAHPAALHINTCPRSRMEPCNI
jgi:hypothetical protein